MVRREDLGEIVKNNKVARSRPKVTFWVKLEEKRSTSGRGRVK
jgi:hypothetical protein